MMAAARRAPQPAMLASISVAPTGKLIAWFNDAAIGHSVIYATGDDLPREAEGVALVRGWVERGWGRTHQNRHPLDAQLWQYSFTKTAAPGPTPRAVPSKGAADAPVGGDGVSPLLPRVADRSDLRRLLSTLRSCAERGCTCPSLSEIADELGLAVGEKGRQRAAYLQRRLEQEGSIAVQRRGNQARPIITILVPGRAQGKATAA